MQIQSLDPSTIPTPDFPLDSMPHLVERLGKGRAARIRALKPQSFSHLPRLRSFLNPVFEKLRFLDQAAVDSRVDDIIQGVARLDHYQGRDSDKPLNIDCLFAILQCLPEISTPAIMQILNLGERQARVYLKATKLIIKHLGNQLDTPKQLDDNAQASEDYASIYSDLWLEPHNFD